MTATRAEPRPESAVDQVAVLIAPANGLSVLRAVFRSLRGGFEGPIVILLHPSAVRERDVTNNLNVASSVMVFAGVTGTCLRNRHAYVVPSVAGLTIGEDGCLSDAHEADPIPDEGDRLLVSLAARYGPRAIVVALTALDAPERVGLRAVRQAGGLTIALDETDRLWADASGPRVVPDAADECLSTEAIGPRMIARLTSVT